MYSDRANLRFSPRQGTISLILVVLLFIYTSAFPAHISLLPAPPDAGAVTQGCEKGSCCTSRCYLDVHGIHHCVPKPGDSCECGMSANDDEAQPVLLETLVTLSKPDSLFPVFTPCGRVFEAHRVLRNPDRSNPTPPPKAIPS